MIDSVVEVESWDLLMPRLQARDRQMYHMRHTRDYEALGIPIGASKAEARKAYRDLAKVCCCVRCMISLIVCLHLSWCLSWRCVEVCFREHTRDCEHQSHIVGSRWHRKASGLRAYCMLCSPLTCCWQQHVDHTFLKCPNTKRSTFTRCGEANVDMASG